VPIQLKATIRELIPPKYQVPAKYWFSALRGSLENELKILGLIVGDDDRVIDIGANRGVYAYRLWKLGSRVEVFEPNPVCNRVLLAWAAEKSKVNVHCVALSDHQGSASLHIPIDEFGVEHDASASMENNTATNFRDQSVVLRTLDSYDFRDLQLIKLDVEGHEYSVIEGAIETMSSSKPAMLVEIEQRHNGRPISGVFKRIFESGYRGFFLTCNGLEPLENFELASHQSLINFGKAKKLYINNFLFLHQERMAADEYLNLFHSYPTN
jgi:FkbM family methyltransferase